jgi:hypothetical protein
VHETGGGKFGLHLMNTEDQLFPHNGLRFNIFSIPDAVPACRTKISRINNDGCDKQQPKGFFGSMNQNISEMP